MTSPARYLQSLITDLGSNVSCVILMRYSVLSSYGRNHSPVPRAISCVVRCCQMAMRCKPTGNLALDLVFDVSPFAFKMPFSSMCIRG